MASTAVFAVFIFGNSRAREAEDPSKKVLSGGSQIPDPDGKVQVYVLAGYNPIWLASVT